LTFIIEWEKKKNEGKDKISGIYVPCPHSGNSQMKENRKYMSKKGKDIKGDPCL